ncbi:ATP-binding protein [Bacillus sp. N9]
MSISIADNGSGISAEQIEQVFYPLFTTKDEGTGIGLPVCKAIVETLGGSISLQNRLPQGTEVRMEIPLLKHRR